jgi:hypothetical protein
MRRIPVHNEELYYLYFTTNIIRVFKSRRMTPAGYVAHKVLVRRSEGRSLGRPIRRWILKKLDGEVWTGLIWLRIGQVAGACECVNEPSGSTKCREFLD